MKKLILCSLTATVIWPLSWGGELNHEDKTSAALSNTNITQAVPLSAIADLHEFKRDSMIWPEDSQIKNQIVSGDDAPVKAAVDSSFLWLETIVRKEWIPNRNAIEVLPLRASVAGCDAIRMRYQLNGHLIQIASTSSGITIVIKDLGQHVGLGPSHGKSSTTHVSQTIEKLFNEADKIKSASLIHVTEKEGGTEGRPNVQPVSMQYWWGLMSWWTDGNVVSFSTTKANGGPLLAPKLDQKWFSASQIEKP